MGEFETYMCNEKCQAYLETLGIDLSDAWSLFKMLDSDGGGTIDVEEFVSGCLNLKGSAKAVHIAKMEHDSRMMRQLLENFIESVDANLEALMNWANVVPASEELKIRAQKTRQVKKKDLREDPRNC